MAVIVPSFIFNLNFFDILLYAFITLIIYTVIVYVEHLIQLKNYPPGPFPVPVLGNVHQIDGRRPQESLQKFGKIYGDVFSISFGMSRVVIVNTIEPMKEALLKKSEDFAGRPQDNYLFKMLTRDFQDVAVGDYNKKWILLRKTMLRGLKTFANHFEKLECKVARETEKCQKRLAKKETNGEPVNLEDEFALIIVGVLYCIMFGEEINENVNEGDLQTILNYMKVFHDAFSHGNLTSVFPLLRFIPIPENQATKKLKDITDDFLKQKYDHHLATLDKEDPKCFLDHLILTAEEINKEGEIQITRDNIELVFGDMMVGGIDTTVVNLLWTILYLLHNPDVHQKALEEIERVVGTGRYPELQDRPSMPYMMSIVNESLRLTSGPFTLPHTTTKATSVGGHNLKKGTPCLFNIWTAHRDEKYWENPNEFKPSRWLDEEGKFNQHLHPSYLPFGLGKRSCVGETTARPELFLILSRLIVSFKISANPNQPLPKTSEEIIASVKYPLPYTVMVEERK
ncbi:steroid 17-alpha-hydroxylase/17,20 lyase-like [Clytia hemisphaerica]|uniref:Uncharacterized protein n=1 Tax=Clytia hemisphaerica TaxID=252671 RepID=A0A7M5WJY3_9CNID